MKALTGKRFDVRRGLRAAKTWYMQGETSSEKSCLSLACANRILEGDI